MLCGVVVFVAADFADGEVVHERPAKSLGALPRRRGSLGPPASAKAGPAGARAVAAVSAAGGLVFLDFQLSRADSQLQAQRRRNGDRSAKGLSGKGRSR